MGNQCSQANAGEVTRRIPGVYEPPAPEVKEEIYSSGRCHIFRGATTAASLGKSEAKQAAVVAVKPCIGILGNELRLVRSKSKKNLWSLAFKYDAAIPCEVTVYFAAKELASADSSRAPAFSVPSAAGPLVVNCNAGQQVEFVQEQHSMEHHFDPKKHSLEHEGNYYPVVVQLVSGGATPQTSLYYGSLAGFAPTSSEEASITIVKQGIEVGGTFHILQEIYGLSGSRREATGGDDATKELQAESECVVCLTDPKNTSLMPCRHLCVCQQCGKDLVERKMRCPVCREPVTELLTLTGQ